MCLVVDYPAGKECYVYDIALRPQRKKQDTRVQEAKWAKWVRICGDLYTTDCTNMYRNSF